MNKGFQSESEYASQSQLLAPSQPLEEGLVQTLITLVLMAPSTAESMNPISPLEVGQHFHMANQPLVLAVDDDDDNLLLLSYALEAFGCKFIGRSDSQTALEVAKAYQPDLILLDVLMPHIDGMEVLQYLKQDDLTCNIPVIAVTALARAEDRQTILLSGFTDYLSKPYMLEDLEALIHRYTSWTCSANQA